MDWQSVVIWIPFGLAFGYLAKRMADTWRPKTTIKGCGGACKCD